jgi:hypothetical protein
MIEVLDEIPWESGDDTEVHLLLGGDFGDCYLWGLAVSKEDVGILMKKEYISQNVSDVIKCKISNLKRYSRTNFKEEDWENLWKSREHQENSSPSEETEKQKQ